MLIKSKGGLASLIHTIILKEDYWVVCDLLQSARSVWASPPISGSWLFRSLKGMGIKIHRNVVLLNFCVVFESFLGCLCVKWQKYFSINGYCGIKPIVCRKMGQQFLIPWYVCYILANMVIVFWIFIQVSVSFPVQLHAALILIQVYVALILIQVYVALILIQVYIAWF